MMNNDIPAKLRQAIHLVGLLEAVHQQVDDADSLVLATSNNTDDDDIHVNMDIVRVHLDAALTKIRTAKSLAQLRASNAMIAWKEGK